jgi:CRISPR-associated DxTHG motif protein
MRKIITFLGVNLQRDRDTKALTATTYRHNDQDYKGFVFAQALYQFCEFDEMLVCMTDKARKDAWDVLLASGEAPELVDDRVRDISIATGWNTDEMWKIFETIVQHVDEGDEVIFDITHSLRSLPFLVFLFAAYLKKAKNVSIQAIYYGAFELARDNGGVAPVIDLSSFVGMLDWLTATDRFTATGDGQLLAGLIRDEMASATEMSAVPDEKRMGGHLERSADAIENISLALALTRPDEVIKAAKTLNQAMTEATKSLNTKVKPFSLVKGQVQSAYGQFAIADRQDTKASLAKQFDMIKWYLDRQQIMQAVTLTREWVISVYCWRFETDGREKVTQALNNLRFADVEDIRDRDRNEYDAAVRAEVNIAVIKRMWRETTLIRNQIAHCGMSGHHQAEDLKQRAFDLYPEIELEIAALLR